MKPPSAILNMNLALNPFFSSFLLSSISSRVSLSPFSRPSGTSSLLASSAGADENKAEEGRSNGGVELHLHPSTWPALPLLLLWQGGVAAPLARGLACFSAGLRCGCRHS